MSLYNIIGEISEKQITKTETGDNRIFGVVVGIVAKNYDKDMPGRVCVTVPVRDRSANELQWARVAMPSSGKAWGQYFLPEVGDQVLLVFEEGNIEKPYVIGCIPKDSNKFLTKAVDESNQYKKITTKNGSTITFEDNKAGDGEKDKITIQTALGSHKILMDNENNKIAISGKDGSNKIEMNTESGEMRIIADQKLVIHVGQGVAITMKGESGEISVTANKLKVSASASLQLLSDGLLKLQGANTIVEASSLLKQSSSGMVTISGGPIKIG